MYTQRGPQLSSMRVTLMREDSSRGYRRGWRDFAVLRVAQWPLPLAAGRIVPRAMPKVPHGARSTGPDRWPPPPRPTLPPCLSTWARAIIRPVCFHPAGLASLQPRRLAVVVFCVITTRLAFCLCFTPICRCCCPRSCSRCCCCCIAIFALIETLKCDKCRVKSCMHANCPLHPFH